MPPPKSGSGKVDSGSGWMVGNPECAGINRHVVGDEALVVSPLLANVYLHARRRLSCATLTILSWAFETELAPSVSRVSFRSGWQSSVWNYIRRRHVCLSSGDSPSETGRNVAKETPRPSRFWDSRTIAEISRAAEPLISGARTTATIISTARNHADCDQVVGKLRLASADRVAYRLYGSLRRFERSSLKSRSCEKDPQSGQHSWL